MPNRHPRMRLSPEEALFLRHWMYDEAHYATGPGPAKQLQLQQRVRPADLAVLIAAGLPDPAEQGEAGMGPPPQEPPRWPWSGTAFQDRLREARAALSGRANAKAPVTGAAPSRPVG